MTEQESEDSNEANTVAGEAPQLSECVDCNSRISNSAKKCAVCHSFQHRGRHFLSLAPALSLIVAIIALLPATVNLIFATLSDKNPRYSVLSFFPDNITGPNGRILRPVDFSVNAQITNLSDETLIVDDSLTCQTRDGVSLEEVVTNSEDDFPAIQIVLLAGFDIYFENTVKAVIPALSTQTISWSVTDEQFVEFQPYHSNLDGALTKFSKRDLETFYEAVLSEFSSVKEIDNEEKFPRGALIENGEVVSFFLNLDCSFSLENSFSQKEEELHLEFVFEFSGSNGSYPRWRIGKNIGGGFGNGFGNGAGGSNGDG